MTLTAGTRIGSFEITGSLGAGGMGEVYRARDTKLDRDVAIKILPELFAADPERIARFEREAKTLATLNHPHIAAIYGLEESAGVRALVMELVEGPTLADRIAHGPIPLDEALPIAKQIAEALEAAHEQGIIHRDLKPANVKVRDDGTVKVLDFGLAKAMEPGAATPQHSRSPTITSPALMTGAGVLLGTAAYMSPEQARGKAVDKRADIWSFGCVFYEMLTGKRAFDGEDLTITIAAVVRAEPEWSALPPDVPEALRLLLKRCLVKEPRARVGDIAVARFLMAETIGIPAEASQAFTHTADARTGDRGGGWVASLRGRFGVGAGIGLLVGVALASAVMWAVMRPAPEPAIQPMRFAFVSSLRLNALDRDVVLSPDGSRVVYVGRLGAGASTTLVVRRLDTLDEQVLQGTEGGMFPFVSYDNRWIGFFSTATGITFQLKKISINGGSATPIATIDGFPSGASWGSDDRIIFGTSNRTTGLLEIPSSGGAVKTLTRPDSTAGEIDHYSPSILPGGRAVLFTLLEDKRGTQQQRIALLDLATGQRTVLADGRNAEYLDSGHVLFAAPAGDALFAAGFDLRTRRITSDPTVVLEQRSVGENDFSISRNGTLVYAAGGTAGGQVRSLVWVSRQGREEPIAAPPRAYTHLRLSPDGKKVALELRDQGNDLWTWDFERQVLTQITFDKANDRNPVWLDNERLIFASSRTGVQDLYRQRADGTGPAERLVSNGRFMVPTSIGSNGTRLALMQNGDLALLELDGDGRSRSGSSAPPSGTAPGDSTDRLRVLTDTRWTEDNPEISPNGRWLAYQSAEEGRVEVFVRSFPDWDGFRQKISQSGGSKPAWGPNGRELFYLDANNMLTAVPVQVESAFGKPARVLSTAYYAATGNRPYDVSSDGQRFLMIKENQPAGAAAPSSIVVVLNWSEELKRLTATGAPR